MTRFLLKSYLFLSLSFLFLPSVSLAYDATPRCFNELERNFFNPTIVKQSFDLFRVFQSQWSPILIDLQSNARFARDRIKERARKMRPNPFDHPFDAKKSKELFLAVEFEIFRDTMVRNYWYDLEATYGMFDFIVGKQREKIDACFVEVNPQAHAK